MCIDRYYIYIYYICNCKLYVHTRWDNPGFGVAAAAVLYASFCGYKTVEVYKSMFKRLERTQ